MRFNTLFSVLVVTLLFAGNSAKAQDDWVSLYKAAQQAYSNDNLEESVDKGKTCLQAYLQQSGEMNGNYRSILRLLVTGTYSLGLTGEGIGYAKKELEVLDAMDAPKDVTYGDALYNLGSLYQLASQYPEAQQALQGTLDIYQQYYASTDNQIIECSWKLASVMYSREDFAGASALFSKSFTDYGQREEVTMDYVQASFDYGSLLVEQGQQQQGVPYLLTVKDIYEASGLEDTEEYAGLLNTLADAHQQVDRAKAEQFYAMATDKYQSLGDEEAVQRLTNNRSVNLQAMGETAQAEALLASATTNGSDISSLNNKAAISQQNGDYTTAEQLYREAMAMVEDKQSEQYAQVAENLAVLLSTTGRNKEALETIGLAVAADNPRLASVRHKKAMILSKLGDYAASEDLYLASLKVLNASADKKELVRALNGLAVLYKEVGRYNDSDSLFTLALTHTEGMVDQNYSLNGLVMNNLAALKEIKGEHLEAKRLMMQCVKMSREDSQTNDGAFIGQLDNLAAIHMELGEYNEAEKALLEARSITEKNFGNSSLQFANNLLSLGRLEQVRGQYTKAEPLYQQATAIIKGEYGENHPQYANALHMTALLYQILGNLAEAEPFFAQCRDIYSQAYGKSHPEYITTIENLSSLYQSRGEYEKALPLLEEALAMDKKVYGEEHPTYAVTLHNLASLYQRQDELQKAEPLFKKALEIDANTYGKTHRTYANTLYNLGTLYQDLRRYKEAEEAFVEAIAIREKVLGKEHPDYAYSLYGLAALYHGTNQLQKASDYYHRAITHYLQQIDDYFPSMSEKEKSAFYSKIKPVFDAFFDFCIDYNYSGVPDSKQVLADMYNLQLSTKALLLNATNKIRNRILNSGNDELINNYREWIGMKEKLVKYFNYSKDELSEQNIDVDELKQQANALEKNLSSMSTEFAQGYDVKRADWKQVQAKLQAGDAAVEMIRITKKFASDSVLYAALVVRKELSEAPELVLLAEGNQLEDRLFNYYRNAIKFSIGDEISYKNYWEPITDHLEGIARVYFSADGIYNKLNINTLWDASNNVNVIDEIEMRLVSNTKELLDAPSSISSPQENMAQIFGYPDFNMGFTTAIASNQSGVRATSYGFNEGITPLPGTEIEVKSIEKILVENQWKNTIHMGATATEDNLKEIKSPTLLHLASHGFFMDDITFDDRDHSFDKGYNNLYANPLLRSGILLTGSAKAIFTSERPDGEDGILTAYEAMNLNLDNTDLVVLSACETGLGQVRNGEGVYGLQRSFIVAGAKSVIMSLWKVNDITTHELMVSFYQNWLGGMNKYEAFKAAQLQLKNKYNDPYHWGAFVLLGK